MRSQPGMHGDGGLADEMRSPVGKLNECVRMVGFCFALISSGACFL